MAVAAPKIAVHLYLNNPYGLISATVPNYSINKVEFNQPSPCSSEPNATPSKEEYGSTDDKSKTSEAVSKYNLRKLEAEKAKAIRLQNSFPEGKSCSRSTSACGMAPLSLPAFYEKTNRQHYNSPHNSGTGTVNGGNPLLGITWSIMPNDKRAKVIIPRKPPPAALLERLGRLKIAAEPLAMVKLRKQHFHPGSYLIQRINLEDKGQRRMSEKLSEWLDQYTEVSQKQQDYLTRIQELRRGLQNREARVIHTIDSMRGEHKSKYKRKFPIYSLSRMEEVQVNQGPAPFPNRPCLFHDEKHGIPKLKIAPRVTPRKLAPIVQRVKTDKYDKSCEDSPPVINLTPRPEMATMKMEYETFESIAKRNRLNLTQFFNSSLSHRREHQRLPLNVSRVTVIEETPEDDPKEFITDMSSRKPVVSNSVKSQNHG